jgi:hypothetical protein
MSVQYGFISPYSVLLAQFSRRDSRRTQAVPYGFRTVRTVTSWHKNRGRLLCGFSGKFGMVFKEVVQPLIHPEICCSCWHEFQGIVQPFGGTEIEEQTCNLLQKILERVLRSLAHFPV